MKTDPAAEFVRALLVLLAAKAVPAPEPERNGNEDLRDLVRQTLAANQPLKASAIARRTNTSEGHMRRILKTMREDGEVSQAADGTYSLPAE